MNIAAKDVPGTALLIPAWSEIIWTLLFLVIFALVFMKFILPKMNRVLDERAEKIQGGLQQAEQAQQEVSRLKETQEQELAEARREAAEIREGARQEGARIIAEAKQRADLEAERSLAAGRQQLDAERTAAAAQLRGEVGTMASELASRIVGESLTDDARSSRVIDRFLDDLESSTTAK
ncbi:F0F1 ATP synthase subunit B [Helcobacillus massiliensis]|uniref:ATP synthase subunit b n=1 Tax=Helcobacillus massiliensis TaxID=521392 RepID=A0A839QTM8_9MICO|nr:MULTISPECIES: F0F1 ATP synthase subunit B [Helcobacillus]MBB3022120.1 F-type H+-transporting ATPase subunit b [Helcobacillus massiliensis]MCG7426814.1 F0F1 ATP synthase subunit B [Helcobacillus sp. ACRRO]MCT1557354.1 F0F1 ATP synthase subunit B [Helcobacillus massiliensis]MCT2037102.1 F0F1 ATP synthase subunit B [Helcobacillus massiliensis]MCT2331639.1 F0F1 ATP synthase subunit B [Helcobacillus massiliensis]